MTFANRFASLVAASLLIFSSTFAQEDIDDGTPPPDVDGLFDEPPGLTPIDDGQVERPRPGPRPADESSSMEDDIEMSPIERPSRFSGGGRNFGSSSGSSGGKKTFNFTSNTPNKSEKLRMDFIQVEIEEVVKYFAEQLKIRFIYDPTILSGKITIVSPEPVSMDEAYQAFLSAMEIRGYVIFPSGPYFKIDKVTNARKSPVPLYLDSTPKDDSYVTRIITLKYLNVRDIRQAVRDLVSRSGGDVIEHAPTNTLIISDYAANIRRIIRILNILDVEGFQEQIAVVPLQFASASDVARKINDIFPTGGANSVGATARRRTTSSGSAANQSVIQKVVADDRTNSLIILGSERGIQQVKAFIGQIDVSIDGGEGGIYVYPLANVKAEELSTTLASLASGQKKAGSTPSRTPRGEGAAASPAPAAAGAASASLFDGEVKITADTTTNSLVIQASRRDFEVLKGIIAQLDIRRRQVFIESVILEAQVNGGSSFGTQYSGPLAKTGFLGRAPNDNEDRPNDSTESPFVFGAGNLREGENPFGLLQGLLGTTGITGLALGFRSGGTVPVPVTGADGTKSTVNVPLLSAIVKLAAENSRLNVLSTPHILATANQPASISIGSEVPQITGSQAAADGRIIESTSLTKIATELNITPQINAGDYVTLEIEQNVDELDEKNSSAGKPVKIFRKAKTTAIVKDGQTIVIGGIMRDSKSVGESKVPFLGDIPILGWLFKSRYSANRKLNLLLFLTPHIIRDTGDMNDVFFQKLREREHFMMGNNLKESKGVPFSGYTKEQMEMLDEDYIKSFNLRKPMSSGEAPKTLGDQLNEVKPIDSNALPTIDPSETSAPVPYQPNLQKALPTDLPTIPVAPRESGPTFVDEPTDSDEAPRRREDFVIPVTPSEAAPTILPENPDPLPPLAPPSPISPSPVESPGIEQNFEPVAPALPPSSPAPSTSPRPGNEGDLPPLDQLLEEDNGTNGAIDSETDFL